MLLEVFFCAGFISCVFGINYIVNLYQLKVNERAIIKKVNCKIPLKKRLEKLGLFEDVSVKVIRKAAFGGPIEIAFRGGNIALRKEDAERIIVKNE